MTDTRIQFVVVKETENPVGLAEENKRTQFAVVETEDPPCWLNRQFSLVKKRTQFALVKSTENSVCCSEGDRKPNLL